MDNCRCYSQLSYEECCKPYHLGKSLPENALKLMRSRYSAYALGLADYIIETTHPANPSYSENKDLWRISIAHFCSVTDFCGLDILAFLDGPHEAFVTFFAHLKQNSQDISFQEKSRFLKVKNRWLYHSGILSK